jgi:hypothetical protein
VLLPYGLWISIEGHVHDWFPYNNPADLLTRQQVQIMLTDLRKHDARVIVTAPLLASISASVSEAGFRPVPLAPGAAAQLWVRGSARTISC